MSDAPPGTAMRSPRARLAEWARDQWLWLVGIPLVAILVWPIASPAATAGVDGSWAAGLHMAAAGGFGTDLVFSHGPLAFLVIPQLWEQITYPLAFLTTFAVVVALVALTATAFARWIPPWAALAASYVLLVALASFGTAERAPDYLTLVVILLALRMVQARLPARAVVWVAAATGAFAGLSLLVKASTGLLAVAALGVAVLVASQGARRRAAAAMAGGLIVAPVLVWLVLGGNPVDIPSWMGYSIEVGRGYAEAMGLQPGENDWHYLAVGVLIAVVVWRVVTLAVAVAWRQWVPVAIVVGLVVLVVLRQGLVRNDPPHAIFAIVALALVIIALPVAGRARWGVAAALVASIAAIVVMSGSAQVTRWNAWPLPRAAAWGEQVWTAANPGRSDRLLASSRAAMRDGYSIPQGVLDAAGDRPTAIDGYEISAAWAYEFDWRPLPVMQSYSAYTAALDKLNAHALASPTGPQRTVWIQGAPTVSGQRPDSEMPATTLALVCNFSFAATDRGWWAWERSRPRCGALRPLGRSVTAAPGEWILVPPAPRENAIVVARMDARLPVVQRLLASVIAPRANGWITLRGAFGEYGYRFVTATGDGPWLMRVGPSVVDELKDQSSKQVEALRLDDVAAPVSVRFEWIPVVV